MEVFEFEEDVAGGGVSCVSWSGELEEGIPSCFAGESCGADEGGLDPGVWGEVGVGSHGDCVLDTRLDDFNCNCKLQLGEIREGDI